MRANELDPSRRIRPSATQVPSHNFDEVPLWVVRGWHCCSHPLQLGAVSSLLLSFVFPLAPLHGCCLAVSRECTRCARERKAGDEGWYPTRALLVSRGLSGREKVIELEAAASACPARCGEGVQLCSQGPSVSTGSQAQEHHNTDFALPRASGCMMTLTARWSSKGATFQRSR